MPRDVRFTVPNRPGMVVTALQAVADVGVEVNGACGDLRPGERWGFLHILVDDGKAAKAALEGAGFEVSHEREVVLHDVEHHAGGLAALFRDFAESSTNLEVVYLSTDGRLVVSTEEMVEPKIGIKTPDASVLRSVTPEPPER